VRLSNACQRPDSEHFVFAQSFECIGGNAAYGDCLADCVKDFDRITFFTVGSQVMINKLDQIAASQPQLGQVAC